MMENCLLPARPAQPASHGSDLEAWSFSKDEAGRWRWIRKSTAGEVLRESSFAFHSLNACVDDAQRSGYARSFATPV
jgi:hypothetical protein